MAAALLSVYATPPAATRKRFRPVLSNQLSPSDPNLSLSHSTLLLNTQRVFFGTTTKACVLLSWNIVDQVNTMDWIGLYFVDENNPFNYLDYKSYGGCGQAGKVRWTLRRRMFSSRRSSRDVHVCFKYYDGLTGVLRAKSSVLSVFLGVDIDSTESNSSSPEPAPIIETAPQQSAPRQPDEFVITAIQCRHLRRGHLLQGQYYAKIMMPPISYKTELVSNTISPVWKQLGFSFGVDATKELEIQIKEKAWSALGNRVLGRVTTSVAYLLEQYRSRAQSTCQYAFVLRPPGKAAQKAGSMFGGQMTVVVQFRSSLPSLDRLNERTDVGCLHGTPELRDFVDLGDIDIQPNASEDLSPPIVQFPDITESLPEDDRIPALEEPLFEEENMASTSTRHSRRHSSRRTSRSESNLSEADRETRGSGLASKNKNSDSGISNCSQSAGDTPSPTTESDTVTRTPSDRRRSKSGRKSQNGTPVKSPRMRRPERLSLAEGYHTIESTAVWRVRACGEASEGETRAALVLKTPHSVCTPCLSLAPDAPSSSRTSQCRCSRRRSQPSLDLILPQHWEARVDRHGRVFFVDHLNRITSWERPHCERIARKHSEHVHRRQMEKRYVCLRRTIGSAVTRDSIPLPNGQQWPAVLFLTRPDFVSFLHDNNEAKQLYSNSNSLRHVIHRIRRDSSRFERYQNNKDLVQLLNLFADKSRALPADWEIRVEPNGTKFFVDHKRRRTTFIDPRLPQAPVSENKSTRRRARSAPPGDENGNLSDTNYQEKVVAFFRRSDFSALLGTRIPALAEDQKLLKKIRTISKVGVSALQRYTNDVGLISVLSVFENDITTEQQRKEMKDNDVFEEKLSTFYAKLQSRGYGQGPGKLKLTLRRERLLTDAFEQLLSAQKRDLQRCKLCIAFDDEDGLDYGGPSREFFFLLSRELFNPYYGLFEYSANDTYTVQISPMSVFVDNYIEWFYFCGRVLGLALIHRYLIDTFFTRAFYKFLLRLPCSVSDLECLDSQFHSSLLWLYDNPVTEDLQLTFSVSEDVGGKVLERDLKVNGSKLAVTEANKRDYIRRMVRWRLERGVRKQAESLLRGFYEVVDSSLISVFDARELELVLSGTVEIDISDWRENTEYKGGYSNSSMVICWFWKVVERCTNAQRLQLLQFVTGTSSIPYEGFAALRGSHGPKRFTVEKWGSPDSLPRAHTCFNRLDLPPYPSFSTLQQKLLLAVTESACYGIE